jgi:hypothetical protein
MIAVTCNWSTLWVSSLPASVANYCQRPKRRRHITEYGILYDCQLFWGNAGRRNDENGPKYKGLNFIFPCPFMSIKDTHWTSLAWRLAGSVLRLLHRHNVTLKLQIITGATNNWISFAAISLGQSHLPSTCVQLWWVLISDFTCLQFVFVETDQHSVITFVHRGLFPQGHNDRSESLFARVNTVPKVASFSCCRNCLYNDSWLISIMQTLFQWSLLRLKATAVVSEPPQGRALKEIFHKSQCHKRVAWSLTIVPVEYTRLEDLQTADVEDWTRLQHQSQ